MARTSSAEPTHVDRLGMMLYAQILKLLGNSMVFRRFGHGTSTFEDQFCKSHTDGCTCLDWTESWSLLNLDLSIACMCLNLFSGSDESAEADMLDVLKFMLQCCRLPDETVARANHVMAFMHTKKGNCQEALSSLKLAQTHREVAGLEPDEGLERDIAKHVKHMKVNQSLVSNTISAPVYDKIY